MLIVFWLFISVFFLPLISIEPSISEYTINQTTQATKKWTIMLYLAADTRDVNITTLQNGSINLDNSNNFCHKAMKKIIEGLITGDLKEHSDNEINIIALYDYPYRDHKPNGHAKIMEITPNTYYSTDWGVTNMGDGNTLDNFISYCKKNYPANNYALVLSDHGRGAFGFCYDYHASHPFWQYALGDCLELGEIKTAIENNNNVDVLIMNSCLGGSFELAWELVDCVDYLVAGETTQPPMVLKHPREFLWHLSRNTSMNALSFAQCCFDAAKNPTKVLVNKPESYVWKTVGLYDLQAFRTSRDTIQFGATTFYDLFNDFTDAILNELLNNLTVGRDLFLQIRNETNPTELSTDDSMLIDLYDLLDKIANHTADFQDTSIDDYASLLRDLMMPGGDIVLDEYSPYYYDLWGFSIFFPDTPNVYRGFLYPTGFLNQTIYDYLDISIETAWGSFLHHLFNDPTQEIPIKNYPEAYCELILNRVDPTVQLHVDYWVNPYEDPMHIGLNNEYIESPGMGVEIGIPGGQFFDDLLLGNTRILVPYNNLPPQEGRNDVKTLDIIVDTTTATSNSQEIHLTVRNIVENEIVWEDTQIRPFDIGEVFICEVNSENEMSELEPIEEPPPTTTEQPTTTEEQTEALEETNQIGLSSAFISISIILTSILTTIVIVKRKKKTRAIK